MHLETAECLASYGEDFYEGMPAVTRNVFGKGITYYIGTDMDAEGIDQVMEKAVADAGVSPVIPENTELEVTRRSTEDSDYYFVMNFKDKELSVPSSLTGKTDLLTGETVNSGMVMKKFDVKIVRSAR